jgi:phosphoribosylanthranilate isomerase
MTKLTALQKAMRIVEKYSPNLFQVYSQDSRDFLSEMKACLNEEKEQIIKAVLDGYRSHPYMAEQYFNETYGGDK